jgi:hypothetical protein
MNHQIMVGVYTTCLIFLHHDDLYIVLDHRPLWKSSASKDDKGL